MDLSTADAKARNLPGHDVFRRSHLLYHDDINRNASVLYLCREALRAFSDTVMIAHRQRILAEVAEGRRYLAAGGPAAGLPPPTSPAIWAQFEWANFENLKVACGFELTLKAILIEKNFIAQEIDDRAPYKSLAIEQRQSPIERGRLMAIGGYRFDGKLNYLPGLRETSLKFFTLVQKPDYRNALALSPDDLDVIDEFRALRNQIHFPGDAIESPKLQALHLRALQPNGPVSPVADFVVNFINSEVVDRVNRVAKTRGDAREVPRFD